MSTINLGLERMERLMEKLRHPERRVKTIHVAGTNGKGSTTAFLQNMLTKAGFFTGTYTSPYWETPAEQIAINGERISDEEFERCINEITPAINETEAELATTVTEFERTTAATLYYFSSMKPVDIAIIETGLGGRRDATNVIVPLVSIITTVGMDHEAWLGDTIRDISREKAGIIKSGVPVFTGATGEALEEIKIEASQKHAKVYEAGIYGRGDIVTRTAGETVFTFTSNYQSLENLAIGMCGDHQVTNATLAVMALDYMKQHYAMMVDEEAIREGLKDTNVPGRLEEVSGHPRRILDTAHNPQAIEALVKTVGELYPDDRFTVLFGVMKDKDYTSMLKTLKKAFTTVVVTTFDDERAATVDELTKNVAEVTIVNDPVAWIGDYNGPLLITGSQGFVGKIRPFLINDGSN
ncbi:bifunctional folylpolyglutamate synthase/dihydrofolate synthase [Alteribacter aurantiacus]|uniref:bifunctional folylpolyglutamate synthase/dihydrofolate synthase n=1 Tax=Alteribacter aurantiacus TaxID=254410 RepID=UPI00040A1E5F|nr:folylpolyglutamate synthase/dihydrofolate synthase family protein [Alteribacter aurantiacus]